MRVYLTPSEYSALRWFEESRFYDSLFIARCLTRRAEQRNNWYCVGMS